MSDRSGTADQVIALPRGGGAVRGLGEKFAPDLHTGTGAFSVPIDVPPGRAGLQPSLALGYSSGSGNGHFGLGWSLGVPGITRQSSRGLPKYDDARDTFVLSGAEDLVAVESGPGVTRYRPRTEGLFARIEHHVGEAEDYWRVWTRDGQVSVYGTPRPPDAPADRRDPAVLADPARPENIFGWRLSRTTDLFGNVVAYDYEHDTGPGWTQSYLRRIRYVDQPEADGGFLVSVVFAYEDRPDELSDRRPTFEVLTRRRCRRIEIHSSEAPGGPTRVLRLRYTTAAHNGCSLLTGIQVEGRDGDAVQSLPELTFGYTGFDPAGRAFVPLSGSLPAQSLAGPGLELVDLTGNGLPDIVETTGSMRSWRNLGDGAFAPPRQMAEAPAGVSLADPGVTLLDADGDGRIDLMTIGNLAGYFPLGRDGEWDHRSFRPYQIAPSFALSDPEVRLVDLDGDGVIDALRTGSRFECFFNDPQLGWHDIRMVPRGRYPDFPDVSFSDPRVRLADMSGDGLQDVVVVHNGRVEYWPSLGRGEWSARREMADSPRFPEGYDPRRVLIGDVDGDGAADLVYVDADSVTVWINRCGLGWSPPVRTKGTPRVSDLSTVRLVDLFGHGVSGLLWSAEPGLGAAAWAFLDLTGGIKPGLLTEQDNGLGAVTTVAYAPSTRFALADERDPTSRWSTTLPFPVQVVSSVRVLDRIAGTALTTEYAYHDGHWDGGEREFRGFGRVDHRDTVRTTDPAPGCAPMETRTWFHQGPIGPEFGDWAEYDASATYWPVDPPMLARPRAVEALLDALPRRAGRDAVRTLRGAALRTELYELDGSDRQDRPVTVTEHLTGVREESPPRPGEPERRRVFFPHPLGTRTTHWDRGNDPMTRLGFTDRYDAYGRPRSQLTIALPRGRDPRSPEPGEPCLMTHVETTHAHRDDEHRYLTGRVASTTMFQPLDPGRHGVLTLHDEAMGGALPRTVLGHALNFYDGAAFQGLPAGQLGDHGVLTRADTLVLTGQILAAVHDGGPADGRVPPYLDPERAAEPAWTDRYPPEFRDRTAPLAGYTFHPGGAGSPHHRGYYTSIRHAYDVQRGPARPGGRGLRVGTRDPFGGETTVRYDRFGLLPREVTDPAGLTTRAEHDYRVFQPRLVTDPNGNRSAFAFTPLGLLDRTAVLGKAAGPVGDTLDAPGTRFRYDLHAFAERSQPASVRTLRRVHHLLDPTVPAAERDELIELVEFSDGFGRVVQSRAQAEDVAFGDPAFGVLEQGGGAPSEIVGRPRRDADAARVIVSGWQVYDPKGRVVRRYEPFFSAGYSFAPPGDAELGRSVTMTYDARARLVTTTHPDGSQQRVVHGIPADLADPDRFQPTPWEAYTYDPNDNAGRTHPQPAAAYRAHWNTPTSAVVDPLGRTVRTVVRNGPTDADLHTTRTEYDIQGNPLAHIDELGRVAFRHVYDLAGRALRTKQLDSGVRTVVLDAAGQLVEQRDSRGALALHASDVARRPVRVWLADDAEQPTILSQVMVYGDAADSGLTAEQAAAANLLGVVVRGYDEAGLVVVERRDLDGNVTDSVRRVVSDDRLASVYEPAAADRWRVRPWRTDWEPPPGVTLEDHAGTLLEETEYRSSFGFDALGRLRTALLPRDVDGHRALARPRYNSAGGLRGVDLDGLPFVLQIGYDAQGRRTMIVYGNGVLTRYAHDPDTFRLTRLRTERFTATGPASFRPLGPPLQDLEYGYDLAGNVLALTDRTRGSGVPANPDAGRVADPALARLVAAGDALVRRFGYDPRYRVVTATGREHDLALPSPPWADSPGGTDVTRTRTYAQGYAYDSAGNLLRLTHQSGGGVPTRTFGVQPDTNRLAALTVGGDEFGYAYDAAGNITAEGDSRHLQWDTAGRLRAFRVQAGTAEPSVHAQYLYDAAGQRVRKVVRRQGGQLDSTTYVGAFEHHRHLGAARRESNTVHVMDDRQRVALVRVGPPAPGDATPPVTYQLGDHLGSAVLVLDGAGGEVSREEFTPYGETSFGGHAFKRYRFTGKERDEETGFSYHGARYYAPWLARWTATDPAGPVDGTNLYQYARSNPMVLTDVSGKQSAPVEQRSATGAAQATQGLMQAGVDILRGAAGLVDPDTYEGMASELGRRYDEAGGGALGVVHAGNMFNPLAQGFEAGVKMGEALGEGDLRGLTRYSIHAALSFVAAKALVRAPASVVRTGAAAAELESAGAAAPHIGSSAEATGGPSVTNPSGNRKLCVADVGAHEANFHRPPGAKPITNEDFVKASGRQVHSIENPIASINEAEKFLNSGFTGLKAEGLITRDIRAELFNEPGRLWKYPGRYLVTIPEQGGAHAIHATVTKEIFIRHSVEGRIVSAAEAAELAADGINVVARKIPKIKFYDPQVGHELTPTVTVGWLKLTW